jgi:hypothetical protein
MAQTRAPPKLLVSAPALRNADQKRSTPLTLVNTTQS